MDLKSMILHKIEKYHIKGITKKDIESVDIHKTGCLLDALDEIYKQKYKYQLEYAYQFAEFTVNEFYGDTMALFEAEVKKYKMSDTEQHHITKFADRLYKHVKKLRVYYRAHKIMWVGISLLFSLLLILGIHWVTDHFVHRFQDIFDAFIIVIVFGVVKLFIEERFLQHKIEDYGWKTYKRGIDITKYNFSKMILSYLTMKKANETGILLKDLIGDHDEFLHSLHNHNE